MIPLYLRLINFESHNDTEIDFSVVDAACIQGINGAGKSALIDGILYALTGETSRGRDEWLISLGESDMTVIYDFIQTNLAYRVIRKKTAASRTKNIIELYAMQDGVDLYGEGVWGTPIATGSEANEKLLQILCRDFKTLTSSSFLLQGQGEKFLSADPSERHKAIFDILGLDMYGELKKKASAKANTFEGAKKSHSERIAALLEKAGRLAGFEQELKKTSESLSAAKEAISKTEALLQLKRADIATGRERVKAFEAPPETVKALSNRKAELEARLSKCLVPITADAADEEKADALLNEFSASEAGIRNAVAKAASLEAKIEALSSIDAEMKSAEERSADISKALEAVKAEIIKHKKILDNKEKILKLTEEEKRETERLQFLRESRDVLIKNIERLNTALNAALQKEAEINRLSADLSKKKAQRGSEIKITQARLSDAHGAAALLKEAPCKGKGEFSACPLLKNAVEAEGQVVLLNKQVEGLLALPAFNEEAEIKSLEKELAGVNLPALKEELQGSTQKADKLKEDISLVQKRLENIKTWTMHAPEISISEAELRASEKELSALEKELQSAGERLKEFAGKKVALGALKAELGIVRIATSKIKSILESAGIKAELDAVLSEMDTLKRKEEERVSILRGVSVFEEDERKASSRLTDLKKTETALISESAKISAEIKGCVDAGQEAKTVEAEIAVIDRDFRIYSLLEEAYAKIPFYILDNMIGILEDEANRVLELINDTGMRVEIKTEKSNKSGTNIKDSVEIIVSDVEGERPVKVYSGGEKTRIALAITVGLAELSARKAGVKIQTLIIDEPSGLDEKGLVDFGGCFIKLVKEGMFKKGLLVTHDPILRDIFDQKILIHKENGRSRVEVIV